MPFTSPSGMFTFRQTPLGNPSSSTFMATLRAMRQAVEKSGLLWLLHSETATEGTLKTHPSMAAPTVPEYNTLIPAFDPWLMPEITRSGFLSINSFNASFTQSTGVPLQTCHGILFFFFTNLLYKGVSDVMAHDIPDRGLSGAKTTISPKSFSVSTNDEMPWASYPSSFVIKISGLFSAIVSIILCEPQN